jgi:hypothetical protein
MKRVGRKRIMNPIAIELIALMKRLQLTKEQLCVQCELRYPTLENVFKRRKVSYATLKALKYGGAIQGEHEKAYHLWIQEHPQKD